MPDNVVQRIMLALNSHGKSVRGSRVGILGIIARYAPLIVDTRNADRAQKLVGKGWKA